MAMRRLNNRIVPIMRYPAHRIYTNTIFRFSTFNICGIAVLFWGRALQQRHSMSVIDELIKFIRTEEFQRGQLMSNIDKLLKFICIDEFQQRHPMSDSDELVNLFCTEEYQQGQPCSDCDEFVKFICNDEIQQGHLVSDIDEVVVGVKFGLPALSAAKEQKEKLILINNWIKFKY